MSDRPRPSIVALAIRVLDIVLIGVAVAGVGLALSDWKEGTANLIDGFAILFIWPVVTFYCCKGLRQ